MDAQRLLDVVCPILDAAGVDYRVIGGVAVNAWIERLPTPDGLTPRYDEPVLARLVRATADVDLVISARHMQAAIDALTRAGLRPDPRFEKEPTRTVSDHAWVDLVEMPAAAPVHLPARSSLGAVVAWLVSPPVDSVAIAFAEPDAAGPEAFVSAIGGYFHGARLDDDAENVRALLSVAGRALLADV